MKKLWKKVRKGSPARSGDASPKSGSLRGSVASLNIGYEVKEKDLGKLHKAAWIGDLNKVKQLAKKDPSPLDKENRTPLHLACVQGNEHIVQELLEWKAKANIGDNQCRTPLMRAVEFQQEGCVHLLLSYRVDIETVDTQGFTPLHIAINGDNLNIINMLMKAGASLDRKNKDGFSPLHLAVKNKYEDVCRLLLKAGANVNVEDPNLRTPLMYACQDGAIALVKLLLEYRADTVHKDSKGWSADDCAVIQGHHACSQLISDYLTKMNRGTPASTPRSSLPPSVVNTPRDKDSIGLPMPDGGGDDSDNEPNSRASGGHGSDSWADSPDVSVSDPRKAKPAQKINMLQFTKNIHISESDTDGESVSRSSLKRKTSAASNGSESEGEHGAMVNNTHSRGGGATNREAAASANAAAAATARQTSWGQSSGDENSWNDSPTTPRKNSSTRVSFKRDEELSEIHDITVTESEAESEAGHQAHGSMARPKAGIDNSSSGGVAYVPTMSTFGKGNGVSNAISADKMKALMDDLGINDDVDDISEMTDEDDSEAQPAVTGGGSVSKGKNNDSDWDASAISDIMTTPRPGILKKTSNAGLGGSQEEKHVEKLREEKEKEASKPKLLIKAPVIESDDESSAWDTTEAEHIQQPDKNAAAPPVAPTNKQQHPHPVLTEQKSSLSEWDSDVEDMIQPVVPQTPTPPVPTLTGTVPKEVEAIVRQKQVECQDFDEDDAMSPVSKTGDTPSGEGGHNKEDDVTQFYTNDAKSNNKASDHNDDDGDDDDDWDSTVDAVTPRQNAGLNYKEVNIGGSESVSEVVEVIKPQEASRTRTSPPNVHNNIGTGAGSGSNNKREQPVVAGKKDDDVNDDDDDDSTWDSGDDALPSETVPSNTMKFLANITGSDTVDGGGNAGNNKLKDGAGAGAEVENGRKRESTATGKFVLGGDDNDEESEEETETVSSWEIERRTKRQTGKSNNSFESSLMTPRQREVQDEIHRKEQEELEAQLADRQAMIEQQRLEQDEAEKKRLVMEKEKEEEERRMREEKQREEEEKKEEEARQRRRRELEEEEERERDMRREHEERERKEREELERWEREDELRREEEERLRKELQEKEQQEWGDEYTPPDTVRVQQEELDRIDQQFQQERLRREEEEKRKREGEGEDEKEKKDGVDEGEELKQRGGAVQEETVRRGNATLAHSSPTKQTSPPTAQSPGAGVYVNIGSSTVEQIRQRLQVPAPSNQSPLLTSTGQFSLGGSDRFDDNDSLFSDNPGDERHSFPPGLVSPYRSDNHLVDDDALSYTSTEFEDPVQSSAAYARDRDVMSNININDPSSLLKVQEYVRDCRRQLEKEKNQRVVFENKVKLTGKEKAELSKKVDGLTQQKSELEQGKLDLEARIRSLEYTLSDEEEKRKNAELLLSKTKEQLSRKESTYASELEAKQKAELTLRNVQIEMRSSANTIKELDEEKEELQRQLTHAQNARSLQEQINDDQHKLIQQQQQQQHQQQHTPRDLDDLESNEMAAEMDKLKAELYALKMEMERQRSRFKDELAITGAENEELMGKVDELRNDIKLNEEALAHATMQYNIQVTSLRTDVGNVTAALEKERAGKDKLEAEVESLKTRLMSANHEMDKISRTRNEIEREHRREKEMWSRDMDRKEDEVNMLKDNSQHLNQRLHTMESKLNSMESELHVSNTSLMERTAQLQQVKQDYDRSVHSHNTLDQNSRLDKEQNAKLQAKMENMQERLSTQQHENLSLRQQLDTLKLSGGGLPGNDANEKLNNILTNLRADSDRAKASMEERNSSLVEQVARYKEELRGSEARRTSLEQDLRRLHEEHSDMVKKLSFAEASLQSALRTKEQVEQERAHLKTEMEKLQHRFQATHDKSIEAQARVSELVDRLEKAETSSVYSNQQLLNTSANMQAVAKSKTELDESMQQLHIENARLEAELKYEKQRADMLNQDLQDSQKVRNSLEALCANLKSSSAHLEDKLGDNEDLTDGRLDMETAARVVYEGEAKDSKTLFDQETKIRSKLGLRIADLERNRNVTESRLGEVKSKADMANEERKVLESRLQAEMDKNQLLQRDVNTLKQHLKSAKNKLKSPRYNEFQQEVGNSEMFISTPRNQPQRNSPSPRHPLLPEVAALRQSVKNLDQSRRRMESEVRFLEPYPDIFLHSDVEGFGMAWRQHDSQIGDSGGDVRNELETKYRIELNRKLADVNHFLDSQSHLRDKLDSSRTEVEAHLLADKRKMEEEINSLRVKYEQAVAQRNMKDLEVKRFQELYESEMKWRMRVSDQLTFSIDKGSTLKSKLNNERHHRNRLHNSIGNLNSTLLSHNNSFDLGKLNGFHDDDLSNKIKAELDRSIAKHLEAAPHSFNTPILRPSKDPMRFSSSLTQANQDYVDILKKKYCV